MRRQTSSPYAGPAFYPPSPPPHPAPLFPLQGNTARLRNVQITDLWEEARRKELPAAEWRTFVRSKLVAPPQQRRRETSIADEFRTALDALAAPFEALGDGISDVAKDVAGAVDLAAVEMAAGAAGAVRAGVER